MQKRINTPARDLPPLGRDGAAAHQRATPPTPGECEMIQTFVAGLINCQVAYVAHTTAAVARGIEPGVVEKLVADVASATVSAKLIKAAARVGDKARAGAHQGVAE